jgi:DNA gyrase subunit B
MSRNDPEDFVTSVRRRPGMYVAGTDRLGLLHLHEYLFAALLETGQRCHLRVRKDGARTTIESDGVLDAEAVIATLAAGNLQQGTEPGWELLTVSALSSAFALDVVDGERWWSWRGERGRAATPGQPGSPHPERPGTTFVFTPDAAIFENPAAVGVPFLQRRLQELAMLTPGLLVDLEDADGTRFVLRQPHGFADWLRSERLEPERVVETAWENVRVRAAFALGTMQDTDVLAFANGVRVIDGGHVEALHAAVEHGWPAAARNGYGWTGAVAVDMPRDRLAFQGPTRQVLAVQGLREGLTQALVEAFR